MSAANKRLGVVVVHHGTPPALLDRAMVRLDAAAPGANVIVVDTGGGSALERQTGWPAALQVVTTANHSYSRAVNVGLERLADPFLVVMNADVLVEPHTFDRLLGAMAADPKTGIAGPLPLTPAGQPQDLGLPYRLAYTRAQRAGTPGARVAWLSGCLQLVDRHLYDTIGGYDESLRFFNEDLEFCLRARRAGWHCRLVATPVVHVGGVSTPIHPAFHVEGRRGGYVLTERYRSPLYALVHRGFLRAESLLGIRLARDAQVRAAHAAMRRLMTTGDWQRSPFGPTLDDR